MPLASGLTLWSVIRETIFAYPLLARFRAIWFLTKFKVRLVLIIYILAVLVRALSVLARSAGGKQGNGSLPRFRNLMSDKVFTRLSTYRDESERISTVARSR
jgi:hypothetical protein